MTQRVPALEAIDVTKIYDSPRVIANDGLSLRVHGGEVAGLLGPNGAGKSTLVRQLVGLSRPTRGEVRLFGRPLEGPASRRARAIAYLPQEALALGDLQVREAIAWTGRLRGLPRDLAGRQATGLMDELAIAELAGRPVRKLSGGQRRLVHIAMTLVAALPVLVLDEPTRDVDPTLRRRVWDLVAARAAAGAAVVLVTHDVSEAEHVLQRVSIIDRGRIVASGTPAELKAAWTAGVRLEAVLAEGAAGRAGELQAALGTREAQVHGRRLTAWVPSDEAVSHLDKLMSSPAAGSLEDVRLVTPTLEDVYLAAVGGGREERS